MTSRLIECVPNFSEGCDRAVIDQIAAQVETVDGVRLLDVDPGQATNRTVVTFVGPPDAVVEAAVRTVQKATDLIDMAQHQGEHPRFGATDVCPLVPVSGVSMDETVQYARVLGRRLGEEVGLTVYCYENAAFSPERRNLAVVRAGEYEGLADKLSRPEGKPDFGPQEFSSRSGATAVGARDFLIAYNVNLNTTSVRRANAIAFDVREKGRLKRSGDPLTGPVVKDAQGKPERTPGSLKHVKAIGWFIEEYGVSQISMNLTNIRETPIHRAFDEVVQSADRRGVRVTGSELVGLIPLQAVLDAGRYFLRKQRRSLGVADAELVKIAVKSMGLDELAAFDPAEKIIEYAIADPAESRLVRMPVQDFIEETASESPAPGGGSVSAAAGALGAALGTMVANLSSHKRGWDERWEEFSAWAEKGKQQSDRLRCLVDADTAAFDAIMTAIRLPKATDEEQRRRQEAIEAATCRAIEVPLEVMAASLASMDVLQAMAETGLATSASDVGVGVLCARTAVRGAYLNVRINAKDLQDESRKADYLQRGAGLQEEAERREAEILALVDEKISA